MGQRQRAPAKSCGRIADIVPLNLPGAPAPSSSSSVPDRALLGIAMMLGAGVVFSLADTCAKELSKTLPLVEITWLRWTGLVAVVLPAFVTSGGRSMRSQAPLTQVFRSLCLVGSSFFFVAALQQLPLASAITISFVSPILVTALSIPLLGEKVGIRRWAAAIVGLIGVLVVIRPGSGTLGITALFPLVSAFCWAMGVITTRHLGHADRPWTAMGYTAIVGFAAMSLFVPGVFVMPNGHELAVAGAMAIFAMIGQFLTLLAFRRSPVSILAPFAYVQLIWSTGLGYLVFGNLPDGWTWLGAGIIVAGGIYTGHRERIRAREAAEALRLETVRLEALRLEAQPAPSGSVPRPASAEIGQPLRRAGLAPRDAAARRR